MNGLIRLFHQAWWGVDDANSVYKVEITGGTEPYGEKFFDDQPTLYFQPVGFLFIRTFNQGQVYVGPAIPIQQQLVYYTQPTMDGFNRGASAQLRLEPGVTGTVEEVRD